MDMLGWQALLAAEMTHERSLALFRELGSLSSGWAEYVQRHPSLSEVERKRTQELYPDKVTRARDAGVRVIKADHFPEPMKAMHGPPAFFAWGDFNVLFRPTIGVVGTRGATAYGKAVAMRFAEAFARSGVTVISGGALGIDAAAARGALSAEGKTVAVLAGGIEQVYPATHNVLFGQIRANGCLISQNSIGSRPSGYRFLSRNHLIAGLSQGVVVIEAPERSGALGTVHAANEQGKQVFVVPANIDNANFKGSHALIRDGATLVDHPDQVLEALSIEVSASKIVRPILTPSGRRIIDAIATAPLSAEFIVSRTGLDTAEVMAELTMLEIDGRVMRDGARYAVRP